MKEESKATGIRCRFCQTPLEHRFLGSNQSMNLDESDEITTGVQESDYLRPAYVCPTCFLVQIKESYVPTESVVEYVSSYGFTWLTDIKKFTDHVFEQLEQKEQCLTATLIKRNERLSYSLGHDMFTFGTTGLLPLIDMYGKADVIYCRDELAYVHDINDFVDGLKLFLKPTGVISFEFLHLLPIMEGNPLQLSDSSYFPYLSFTTVDLILKKHGLIVFDVGNDPSQKWLRILVKHAEDGTKHISNRVTALRGRERSMGMSSLHRYSSFNNRLQNSFPVNEVLYFVSRQ